MAAITTVTVNEIRFELRPLHVCSFNEIIYGIASLKPFNSEELNFTFEYRKKQKIKATYNKKHSENRYSKKFAGRRK